MCGLCYGDICSSCALELKGRKDRVCKDCALTVSGVRGGGKIEARGDKRTAKERRKEYANAEPHDQSFQYFDAEEPVAVAAQHAAASSTAGSGADAGPSSTEVGEPTADLDNEGDTERPGLRRLLGRIRPDEQDEGESEDVDFIPVGDILNEVTAPVAETTEEPEVEERANDDAVSRLADLRQQGLGDAGSTPGDHSLMSEPGQPLGEVPATLQDSAFGDHATDNGPGDLIDSLADGQLSHDPFGHDGGVASGASSGPHDPDLAGLAAEVETGERRRPLSMIEDGEAPDDHEAVWGSSRPADVSTRIQDLLDQVPDEPEQKPSGANPFQKTAARAAETPPSVPDYSLDPFADSGPSETAPPEPATIAAPPPEPAPAPPPAPEPPPIPEPVGEGIGEGIGMDGRHSSMPLADWAEASSSSDLPALDPVSQPGSPVPPAPPAHAFDIGEPLDIPPSAPAAPPTPPTPPAPPAHAFEAVEAHLDVPPPPAPPAHRLDAAEHHDDSPPPAPPAPPAYAFDGGAPDLDRPRPPMPPAPPAPPTHALNGSGADLDVPPPPAPPAHRLEAGEPPVTSPGPAAEPPAYHPGNTPTLADYLSERIPPEPGSPGELPPPLPPLPEPFEPMSTAPAAPSDAAFDPLPDPLPTLDEPESDSLAALFQPEPAGLSAPPEPDPDPLSTLPQPDPGGLSSLPDTVPDPFSATVPEPQSALPEPLSAIPDTVADPLSAQSVESVEQDTAPPHTSYSLSEPEDHFVPLDQLIEEAKLAAAEGGTENDAAGHRPIVGWDEPLSDHSAAPVADPGLPADPTDGFEREPSPLFPPIGSADQADESLLASDHGLDPLPPTDHGLAPPPPSNHGLDPLPPTDHGLAPPPPSNHGLEELPPPTPGATVLPTIDDDDGDWTIVDDVPDLDGTTPKQRADIDARGSWIPPALRGSAPDAGEAGQNLPRRRD